MAERPEARAQLVRLIGLEIDPGPAPAVAAAVDARFDLLLDGITAELIASDDVFDRESARAFLASRLAFLGDLLTPAQRSRLSDALEKRIEAW